MRIFYIKHGSISFYRECQIDSLRQYQPKIVKCKIQNADFLESSKHFWIPSITFDKVQRLRMRRKK